MSAPGNFLQALFGQLKQGLPGLAGNLSNTFNQESIYNRLGAPGVQADQQAKAQQAQLNQQLGFHQDELAQHAQDRSTLSADQQAMLGQQQQNHQDVLDQQSNLGNKDIISMLAQGGSIVNTPQAGAVPFNGKFILPPPTHTITPDSPLGKTMALVEPMTNVPHGDYLKYSEKLGEKQASAQVQAQKLAEKQANEAHVEALAQDLHGTIDRRFGDKHYEYIYGPGQVDPEASQIADEKHKMLNMAAAEDKAHGTTTSVRSVMDHINSYTSDWEKMKTDQRKKEEAFNNQLGLRGNTQDYESKVAALKMYKPAQDAAQRFNIMSQNLEDAVGKGDQQAMLSLLANHLGMTVGAQKSIRTNQAVINEAIASRPWLQGMQASWSPDGQYLTGVTLSPQQMKQMVDLGRSKYLEEKKQADSGARYMGIMDGGPKNLPSKATVNYYKRIAGGNKEGAQALASQDGWSVE